MARRTDSGRPDSNAQPGAGDSTGSAGNVANPSRRSFLRGAGIAAASTAAAGAAVGVGAAAVNGAPETSDRRSAVNRPSSSAAPTLPPRPGGPGFDHLVVVMFENRSFDNIFGYLYDDQTLPEGQKFDGLHGGDHANAAPDGTLVPAHPYTGSTDQIMSSPQPDPGEEYPHVNTQLFGTVAPESNRALKAQRMTKPFNAPADTSRPTMSGFVNDYVNNYLSDHQGELPSPDQYGVVMGSFTPDMLPVFSTLAREFAVYDNWHCAVPSQTFCNRSFFHASTSHGFVTNHGDGGYGKWLREENAAPTIFNRLGEAGLTWRVYYDRRQVVSMTGLIHGRALEPFWKSNFRTMEQFYRDVETGDLPDYAFIEPRMVYDHNDMHPPVGPFTETDYDGRVVTGGAISDVRAGERLLHQVYTAVRASASERGSNALNTLLLATFDEHGGTYDHVPPPAATPPDGGTDGRTSGGSSNAGSGSSGDDGSAGRRERERRRPNEMDFTFDRLGVRVPAIAISAYTKKGSVINELMHHGSVISTLAGAHGLEPLTARDAGAPTLQNAVMLEEPRQVTDWPQTHPQYVPANPEADLPDDSPFPFGQEERPLSAPGVGLVGMLTARFAPGEKIPETYAEARATLDRHGRGLFGTTD